MPNVLQKLEARNAETLAFIKRFRADYQSGQADFARFSREKHQHKYFGFVECKAADHDFILFQANDDIVAWEYLWFGPDAYESEIIKTWVDWSARASTILDIGGYTGVMSILGALSNPSAEVHLFEPMDRTVERAKINVRANGLERRIRLHNKAASDTNREETINLYREENFLGTGNSLYDKGLAILDRKTIQTVALDEYLPDIRPELIKVDVEGHELACLTGMRRILTQHTPRLIVEIWEHNRPQVLELLTGLGYQCAPFENREQRVMNFTCTPHRDT